MGQTIPDGPRDARSANSQLPLPMSKEMEPFGSMRLERHHAIKSFNMKSKGEKRRVLRSDPKCIAEKGFHVC